MFALKWLCTIDLFFQLKLCSLYLYLAARGEKTIRLKTVVTMFRLDVFSLKCANFEKLSLSLSLFLRKYTWTFKPYLKKRFNRTKYDQTVYIPNTAKTQHTKKITCTNGFTQGQYMQTCLPLTPVTRVDSMNTKNTK